MGGGVIILHLHKIVKKINIPLDSCPGNSESCSDDNDNAQKKFQWPRIIPLLFAFDIFGIFKHILKVREKIPMKRRERSCKRSLVSSVSSLLKFKVVSEIFTYPF